MRKYENDCVGCPQGCISCGLQHSLHVYCDECGEDYGDPDHMYDVGGKDICEECLLKMYPKISI